ncbi:unnamed protein product [Spirodela intermedia]|uniref:Uncharacterized protein n=1 Tax=Spirodela intermedia TaxID=51605 RepID=A0ABN7EAN6_SPIIN|nr:unnamed protein product [Spirodela intermedia]
MLYWPIPNALYVEDMHLTDCRRILGLQPVHQIRQDLFFKVGLVLDSGMEEELRIRHLQVADAARASLGLPVVEYILTDFEIWIDPACGKSTGRIGNPRSKVNAVAVVGRFPDDDIEGAEDYRQGKGVDVVAGVEAIISHLVVKEFQIPLGTHSLPCVLAGLSRPPVSAWVIAVEENTTVMDDTPEKLGIDAMKVSNYWEAVGVVAAHRAGVDPRALRRRELTPLDACPRFKSPLSLSSSCDVNAGELNVHG